MLPASVIRKIGSSSQSCFEAFKKFEILRLPIFYAFFLLALYLVVLQISDDFDNLINISSFQFGIIFPLFSLHHLRHFLPAAEYMRYSDPTLKTEDNEFSCLVYTLEFVRRPTYFVMNVIMPSVLINCLCVLNFGVPHETGEKVGYGITVFLAQSVNLMVVSEMMPQG